jgi:hypothetical protein
MLTRKSLPTWMVRQSNGLLYAYGTRQYVPNVFTLRSRVLHELHNAPTAGHHGIIRLLVAVTRTFWWPNIVGQYNTMYANVLHANVTRHRDTSPMDSFNRTRYRPGPYLNTFRLTWLRTFLSAVGIMLWWYSCVCLRNGRLSSQLRKRLQRSNSRRLCIALHFGILAYHGNKYPIEIPGLLHSWQADLFIFFFLDYNTYMCGQT